MKILHIIISFTILFLLGSGCNVLGWPSVGVVTNKIGLKKNLIADCDCCFRGYIRSIQVDDFDGDKTPEIAIIPQTGILFYDLQTLKVKAQLDFQDEKGETIWFGLTPELVKTGSASFVIAQRGDGYGEVGLLTPQAKRLWSFHPNKNLPPLGMVVDHADTSGSPYYVADRDQLYRLNSRGQIVWKIKSDVSSIDLIRHYSKGSPAIAALTRDGNAIRIYSPNKELLREVKLRTQTTSFAAVESQDFSGFVLRNERHIELIDLQGNQKFTYSFGSLPVYHGPVAALVSLEKEKPPLLVVRMTSSSAEGKSALVLFTLGGDLVYKEILDGGPAIAAIPIPHETRQKLLLGEGVNRLWAYETVSLN